MLNNLKPSSKYFIDKTSLIYFSKYDFSHIFHYFSKRILSFGFPKDQTTQTLQDYIESWQNINKSPINSFENLESLGIKGYFKLNIQKKVTNKRLATYIYKDEEFYIISGVYIFSEAKSFLTENNNFQIKGYVLDTTWRIMPMYVTSILAACFLNYSVPIGFSFDHGETKANYDSLLKTIEKQLSINFFQSIFESDQGKALLGLFKDHQITHLACLRHLLASYKNTAYSYECSQLLKCQSQFEYDNCKKVFADKFSDISAKNPQEFPIINKALGKIGLEFSFGEISVKNDRLWNEVSLLKRIKYSMPSTTNTLEATHGHLNARTPRRNGFYTSLFRIITELDKRYLNSYDRIRHNFNRIKRNTLNQLNKLKSEEISKMCLFYNTTINQCLCGQNKLISSNFGIDIPCIHRLFKGAAYPELPKFHIISKHQFDKIVIERNTVPPDDDGNHDSSFYIKNYAFRVIKQFSRFKDEKLIRKFVEENYKNDDDVFFINNQYVSLIQMIEEGIYHFIQMEKKNPNKTT